MDLPNVDISSLKKALSESTSAMQAIQISREIETAERFAAAQARENARRNALIEAGARANIEQVGLLEKQLEEVKLQNEKLYEANKSLNALYEQAKKDAEANAKIAEKSKLQARISIGISIFAVVVSIVMGILGIVL